MPVALLLRTLMFLPIVILVGPSRCTAGHTWLDRQSSVSYLHLGLSASSRMPSHVCAMALSSVFRVAPAHNLLALALGTGRAAAS